MPAALLQELAPVVPVALPARGTTTVNDVSVVLFAESCAVTEMVKEPADEKACVPVVVALNVWEYLCIWSKAELPESPHTNPYVRAPPSGSVAATVHRPTSQTSSAVGPIRLLMMGGLLDGVAIVDEETNGAKED